MATLPSRKRKKLVVGIPNIVPLIDGVFNLLFFLLLSASFIHLYEIPSDVPIVSEQEPDKDKIPLNLTLVINDDQIQVKTGVPAQSIFSVGKAADGSYDLDTLRTKLVAIKQEHMEDKTAFFQPEVDLTYGEIVQIMDAVRETTKTDPELYTKDANGLVKRSKELFPRIIFSNIQS